MSNYRRGADLERKVRLALLERGAILVVRSAGSKTPVDLIAFWGVHTWFIQVKRTGKLYGQARQSFIELAHQCGAVPVLAYPGKRGEGIQFQVIQAKEEAA